MSAQQKAIGTAPDGPFTAGRPRKLRVSLRPRKMKQIELTVLSRDTDAVIEFLGRRSLMQFSGEDAAQKARAPYEAVSKK
ncbi:MAG: hypothetical protein FWC45_03545, partial [Treponema sp.]|nr:hypothetical protein [Treponema sp.]